MQSKIVNSLWKAFPDREPPRECRRMSALRGERLNFQLVYRSDNEYTGCDIRVKGDLSFYTSLRLVEECPADFGYEKEGTDDYYLEARDSYPDLLAPFLPNGFSLPAASWRAVWVSVDIPSDAPAGESELSFTLTERGKRLSCRTMKVRVADASLCRRDLVLTNWLYCDCISSFHGAELFSEEFYQILANYLDEYVSIGFNTLLTPVLTPALDTAVGGERRTVQLVRITERDGKYLFDFGELERFVRFAQAHGIKYFEMSHLFTQWGAKACPKVVLSSPDGEKKLFGWEDDSLGERYLAFLGDFLPALVDELFSLGIAEHSFSHLTDEPDLSALERYSRLSSFVKPLLGGIPVIDALSDYEYCKRGLVEIPVTILQRWKDFEGKRLARAFVYYCCSTTFEYLSNRLLEMPLQRTRVIGFQLYETGVHGFLHWGFNFYNTRFSDGAVDPYRTTTAGGLLPSGDAFLVYPKGDGVLLSLRAEAMREAFQDYYALCALEERIGRQAVLGLLHEAGFHGFSEYPRSAEKHLAFREKINRMLF